MEHETILTGYYRGQRAIRRISDDGDDIHALHDVQTWTREGLRTTGYSVGECIDSITSDADLSCWEPAEFDLPVHTI